MDEGPRTLAELLREAAALIDRLSPAEALERARAGALIVDIRSDGERDRNGVVPGSIHIPRTVLEWRLEPGGAWRNPNVDGVDRQIIVLCDHGYSSVLAAATLARLGYAHVADVVGGFEAWLGCGLPTEPPRRRDEGGPVGMSGPE